MHVYQLLKFFYIVYDHIIVVLGVYYDIYQSSYSMS
jgi:hypothetical protein